MIKTGTQTKTTNEKYPVAKIIGERIRLLRISQGMTQRVLAGKMDVCLQTVWYWEAGERSPSIKRICLLAKILNTPTDYLLGLTDDTLKVVSQLMNAKRIAEDYICILINERKELEKKVEEFKTMISTNAVLLQATINKYGCRLPDEDVKEIEEFLKQLVRFNP